MSLSHAPDRFFLDLTEAIRTDGNRRSDKLGYRPMNRAALEAAREKRMKEVKMWDVIKEIASYFIYLWVLLVLSYGNRDPNAYLLKSGFEGSLLRFGDDDFDYRKASRSKFGRKFGRKLKRLN